MFKQCSIGNKSPKCAKKISPTPLHQHQQPEPLRQGRMIHAFMFFTPNSDPTSECGSRNQDSSDQVMFFFRVLQGSMCCVFRDGILQILVVTSGYLSYCCLSIISNQSVHSPLTSDIIKAFSSTQLPLTGYFLFFGPFSVNTRDGYV